MQSVQGFKNFLWILTYVVRNYLWLFFKCNGCFQNWYCIEKEERDENKKKLLNKNCLSIGFLLCWISYQGHSSEKRRNCKLHVAKTMLLFVKCNGWDILRGRWTIIKYPISIWNKLDVKKLTFKDNTIFSSAVKFTLRKTGLFQKCILKQNLNTDRDAQNWIQLFSIIPSDAIDKDTNMTGCKYM